MIDTVDPPEMPLEEVKMITVEWATRSDVGLRRASNEDSVVAAPPVFAVADGMGGHAAGDVASAMAVAGLARLSGHLDLTRRDVLEAIRTCNDDISSHALDADTQGMGTTIAGLAIIRSESGSDSVVVFNVGDSRTYLLRDGSMTQVSHDHSVVQELIDDGVISATEAEQHPERNVITRSLGAGAPLDIDWWMIEPRTDDRFLVCSDGLFKGVADPALAQVLVEVTNRDEAATTLLDAALAAGGIDNISLVIVDVTRVAAAEASDVEDLDGDTQPKGTDTEDDDTNPTMRRPVAKPLDMPAEAFLELDGGDTAPAPTTKLVEP